MSSLEYYPPFPKKYSHNQYIKFENLQIVSPSEDVNIINVLKEIDISNCIFLKRGRQFFSLSIQIRTFKFRDFKYRVGKSTKKQVNPLTAKWKVTQ